MVLKSYLNTYIHRVIVLSGPPLIDILKTRNLIKVFEQRPFLDYKIKNEQLKIKHVMNWNTK